MCLDVPFRVVGVGQNSMHIIRLDSLLVTSASLLVARSYWGALEGICTHPLTHSGSSQAKLFEVLTESAVVLHQHNEHRGLPFSEGLSLASLPLIQVWAFNLGPNLVLAARPQKEVCSLHNKA